METSWGRLLFIGPNLCQQSEDFRLGLLKLGPIERIEVIDAEEGFRHFSKELLVVSKGIMFHALAIVKQHSLAVTALLEFLVRFANSRFVERKHLVVISMGQLVQDDPRLFVDVAPRRQIGSA